MTCAPEKTRILTVDDSPSMRALLMHALTAEGFHVDQADDGVSALDWLKENECDVVITDINQARLDLAAQVADVVPVNVATTDLRSAVPLPETSSGRISFVSSLRLPLQRVLLRRLPVRLQELLPEPQVQSPAPQYGEPDSPWPSGHRPKACAASGGRLHSWSCTGHPEVQDAWPGKRWPADGCIPRWCSSPSADHTRPARVAGCSVPSARTSGCCGNRCS